jgi:hypothetical protein
MEYEGKAVHGTEKIENILIHKDMSRSKAVLRHVCIFNLVSDHIAVARNTRLFF